MTRRKRKSELRKRGGGAARNPNSLANLIKPPPATIGNTRAMTHGFRSAALVADVAAETLELMAALAEAAPVRDSDGGLPAADTVAIETAARALKRYRAVCAWLDLHGRLDDKGNVKEAARYELAGERALGRALDVLGMNPQSRVRLGLNLARTAGAFDLARHWQQADADGTAEDDG